MKLTTKEKETLQYLINNANELDEENGMITYFCCYANESNIKGLRGLCSSLIKKNIICITDRAYSNVIDIPIDNNYKILFDKL